MQKYSFLDDYSEGCHPHILDILSKSNYEQNIAYGFDKYSKEAKEYIHKRLKNPSSEIFFVSAGTQANLIITSASLRSHEAIISVDSGHILGREAGALEATGHKIISIKTNNGKLNIKNIQTALDSHSLVPHMVKPKLVYISNATEIGTIYTKDELISLYNYCQEKKLLLFIDGARLGAALCSENNDITLEDLAKYTDVFTIGATKNGALFGEAIILNNTYISEDFNINIKQRGALLAKGKILGIQFLELFKENLYFDLANKSNKLAKKLADGFTSKGYKLLDKVQTNQIFLILPNNIIEKLQNSFLFYEWEKYDEDLTIVRFVTSWTSDEKKIDELLLLI